MARRPRPQHGRGQDADVSDVRDVCDDDRLGGHHHPGSHQDVRAVADGGRHLSVRHDGGHRACGAAPRTARGPARPAADDVVGARVVRRGVLPVSPPANVRRLRRPARPVGMAIGVFKTGALALIGDISTSTAQHTAIMNMAEGFFGVGAIIGPAILARLLECGAAVAVAVPDRRRHLRRC